MKKTIIALVLIAGFIVGWGTALLIANRNIEKIKRGWSPDFQKFVAENIEFCNGLTRADMEQLRKDIHDYKSQAAKESEIQTLWQVILATQIQAALAQGDTNLVHKILEKRINVFKESRAKGLFKGSDLEKFADALALRVEAGTNAPTTGRAVPPEAGAPGVQ